ncbi:MAG: adenine phosphoribosyltransferase [Akkermansiaceae bacterium]
MTGIRLYLFMPDRLKSAIRDILDFPKEGIIFKDISPILSDPDLLQLSVDLLLATAEGEKIDKVVGIDARGFLFATPVALALKVGFVPVRKKGKLPRKTFEESYTLEYGDNTVEIHQDAIQPGDNVLLIDDLLATGGTASAAVKLINKLGANLVRVAFLIELDDLNGKDKIDAPVTSIIHY